MALIACKECGNQISTQATSCPQCGAKTPRPPMGRATRIFGAVFMIIAACFFYAEFAHRASPEAAGTAYDSTAESLREATMKRKCKEQVLVYLKAPSSAEFVGEPEFRLDWKDPAVFHVTGAIDAQNSWGAKLRNKYFCDFQAGDYRHSDTMTMVDITPHAP